MDNSFQTSFIPKKPVGDVIKRDHKTDLFTMVSILVLVLVILASGALYVYQTYLIKQKEALIISIEKSRSSFDEAVIRDLESFDKKASAVQEILSKHKVLTPLFFSLEQITIPNVQYTSFNHEEGETDFIVKIEGIAKDYKSISQQSDVFNSPKGSLFKNVVFSDLIKSDKGETVKFQLEFSVDPSLLSYEKNLLTDNEDVIQN